MTQSNIEETYTGLEIAVIGMSGRFPGADTVGDFWEHLKEGKEMISFFTDEELREANDSEENLNNPLYVKSYGWIEGIECFDAAFFGYTPAESEIMDPQVRLFHECVWSALEDAGYDPESQIKPVGLYAGASGNVPWQIRVELSGKYKSFGRFVAKQLHDKDYICTRISYKLNLKGPAITVDSACSSSLLAVHSACQGLLSGDCDIAVAGGVSVGLILKRGYYYVEGMVGSPDGHCRAFDAQARGSNFGNGAAAVVLKRYDDAAADDDTIHAIIRGSAANNDGKRKAAYTAPSIDGQAQVVRTALRMAEVEPDTLRYVETHGTGTSLGDPVEIEGLKNAFDSTKRQFCRIGSVKTNIGHLEAASGISGFIKTVLTVKHRLIPPSLFFETPNPKIDFKNSPFIVNTRLHSVENEPGLPFRAGVSSFGIGGTNVHVILEEAPPQEKYPSQRETHLLLLSARTSETLEHVGLNLRNYLEKNKDINLADVAYTLYSGRKKHIHRRMVVCSSADEAVRLLDEPNATDIKTKYLLPSEDKLPLVFVFPGQGNQYVNMGRQLYEEEPLFRETMDQCFRIIDASAVAGSPSGIKSLLYPDSLRGEVTSAGSVSSTGTPDISESIAGIRQPEIAQAVIFSFQYALAKLLISWGINPYAMIGYSFGEYTAACVSGVFSLEDALKIIIAQGSLLRDLSPGAMLSVPLSADEMVPLLAGQPQLHLAIDNGPSCVVAGPVETVAAFEKKMKAQKMSCVSVPLSGALHSPLVEPIKEKFEAIVGTVSMNPPNIPYVSNVTGKWIEDDEAVNPRYWGQHLSRTVQFNQGINQLVEDGDVIFIEIGPGSDTGTFLKGQLDDNQNTSMPREDPHSGFYQNKPVINLVRTPNRDISDVEYLISRIGILWLHGHSLDWNAFCGDKKRRRISLPAYPFEKQRHWIEDEDLGDYRF